MTHDLALGLLFWIWSLTGGRSEPRAPSSAPQPSSPPALPAGTSPAPAPWPQVVPGGVPTFPGSAWEYDEPPPAAVQAQARQLLNSLWAKGSGTHKILQTGGRWIAYQAAIVASGKKGVVAWRLKKTAPRAAPRATPRVMTAQVPVLPKTAPSSPAGTPKIVPVGTPTRTPIPQRRPTPEQAAAQSAASQRYSLPLPQELPDLKVGVGLKPQPANEHVKLAQERLIFHGYKLPGGADGRFGEGTRMAVIELQKRSALAPRVDNAELVKRGFGAIKRATWEVLLQDRPLLSSPPLVRA